MFVRGALLWMRCFTSIDKKDEILAVYFVYRLQE